MEWRLTWNMDHCWKIRRGLVCKLKKTEAVPRCWSKTFTGFMKDTGFVQSTSDPCVFVRSRQELEILAVYVDDLILIRVDGKHGRASG